jgi:bacterioferritin-associated ferredoxin
VVVCHCEAVNDERIRAEIRSGALTLAEIARTCRAGATCGGCLPFVAELVDEEVSQAVHLRSVHVA